MRTLLCLSLAMLLLAACSGRKDNRDVIEFTAADAPAPEKAAPVHAPENKRSVRPAPEVIDSVTGRWGIESSPRLADCRNLAEVFNDSNFVHSYDAHLVGIDPLVDLRSIWQMRRPIVKISTNPDFVLDRLTHSAPYLVPEAAEMVHEIGRRFSSNVKSRHNADVRMIVTSVLRTPDAVRRLRRVNRNAVESSVHQMGTTVDITYNNFAQADTTREVPNERLKMELAEVLDQMRAEGRLWVKFEKHQPCFHITVRKTSDK